MVKLEVKENKKLVLKNVVVKELRNISLESVDEAISKAIKQIQVMKIQSFGPLVTKNYGMVIHEDGTATINYDVMVQAHDYKQYQGTFKTYEKLTNEYCLYLRFEDSPEYLPFAYNKLDLYLYENDLEPEGSIINVLIEDSENQLIMDIFKPVKQI